MYRQLLVLTTVVALIGPDGNVRHPRTSSSSATDLLESAFASIGGRAAYRNLAGVRVTFSRSNYIIGQEEWPGAVPSLGATMDGVEYRDFARPGLLTRYHLANVPRTFTRLFMADSAAFMVDTIVSGFGFSTPDKGYAPVWRDDPVRILRGIANATDDRASTAGARTLLGRSALGVDVRADDDTVRVWLDAKSNVPVALERVEDDPVSGRRITMIALAGWISAGNVKVPGSVVVTQNGHLTESQLISQAQVNANFDSAFAAVPKKPATRSARSLAIVELAPGIYRAEGVPAGGVPYNSAVAVTNDSVFVFDPPISDSYASAILDSVKARFPNARARMFVVSHHHADHVSGARAAFAAGMPAIASAEIADYVRLLGVREGQKAPRNRRVIAVRDTMAVGSGPSRFVLYHVPTSHARGLIMAYFPEAKLIAEVDLAAGLPQDRRDLYDFVSKRGLAVEKLARMHGAVLAWSTFAQPFQKAQ